MVKAKLVLCAEPLFKEILAEVLDEQVVPAHPQSTESKRLDSVSRFARVCWFKLTFCLVIVLPGPRWPRRRLSTPPAQVLRLARR